MPNPLVSVLMTAYNREKYIASAIESVLNSTYENFELIITDDGSKDKTVEIVSSYAKKDSRVKLFINEENLGDYPNRNKAASLASGEYLKYVDADDYIYPWGLEILVRNMEEYPGAGWGLCSLAQDAKKPFPFVLNPQEAYYRHYFEQPLFHKAPLSAIMRKRIFEEVGGFTGKQYVGDFEMWHKLGAKYPVVLMPHGVVWYRVHDDQQMSDYRVDPFVASKYLVISKECLKHKECPLSEELRTKALNANQRLIARSIVSAGYRHSVSKAIQIKNHAEVSLMDVLFNLV